MNTIDLGPCQLQYDGSRLWIHSHGGTVIRIKAIRGAIVTIDNNCSNNIPHCDIETENDIDLCIPKNKPRQL